MVHEKTLELGGIPAPLNFERISQKCVHIPQRYRLPRDPVGGCYSDGWGYINVDVTTIVDGYYADASRMYCIGQVSPEAKRLVM